jgi:hypothetical protein
MNIAPEHIVLFRSFFRGRNDLNAVRWEKDGKSGYMPEYNVDWTGFMSIKPVAGLLKIIQKKNSSRLETLLY